MEDSIRTWYEQEASAYADYHPTTGRTRGWRGVERTGGAAHTKEGGREAEMGKNYSTVVYDARDTAPRATHAARLHTHTPHCTPHLSSAFFLFSVVSYDLHDPPYISISSGGPAITVTGTVALAACHSLRAAGSSLAIVRTPCWHAPSALPQLISFCVNAEHWLHARRLRLFH